MSTPSPAEPSPAGKPVGEPTPGSSSARPRSKPRVEGKPRPSARAVALAEREATTGEELALATVSDAQDATEAAQREVPTNEADASHEAVAATNEALTSAAATNAAATNAVSTNEAPTNAMSTSEASTSEASASEVPTNETAAASDEAAPPSTADRKRVRLLAGLAVAAVLLVAASVLLAVAAFSARKSGPLANEAFVNTAATAEVVGQVTNAISTVYSYNYATLPANEAAAKAVITGKFADEFGRVFEPVKQLAPQEQAVLKSTVPAAGVLQLQGDRARLLMMVNQAGVRGTDKQPTGATARLVVDAQKVDGQWKISGVTPE